MNICPVCGYKKLPRPPENFLICPSCGTEFGYDDFKKSHEELRYEWMSAGMHWFSRSRQRPANWNPLDQLASAGYAKVEYKLSSAVARGGAYVTNEPIVQFG
jgi:hypothetical protein